MKKPNLLLIENDLDDINEIKEMVVANYDVATTYEEFLDKLSNLDYYDAVISDFSISTSFTGFEVISNIKSLNPAIPIIIISGIIGEEKAVSLMKDGAADFLLKRNIHRLPEIIHREVSDFCTKKENSLTIKQATSILLTLAKSSKFVLTHKTEDIDIDIMLKDFGKVANASKACLYLYKECNFIKLNEWCSNCDNSLYDTIELYTYVYNEIINKNFISLLVTKDSPDYDWFTEQKITSLAALPILTPDQNVIGLLAFYNCILQRNWSDLEMLAFQNVAQLIGIVLYKKELEQLQKEKEEKVLFSMKQSTDTLNELINKLS